MFATMNVYEKDLQDVNQWLDDNGYDYYDLLSAIALMIENDELGKWF